ncbi:MAG TPA: CHRD domain-containing protein, partial [Solirubrobacteraceae bacterium]|nr:CHRD domain-containing protein [Solirubrobacteraceae bacterium]
MLLAAVGAGGAAVAQGAATVPSRTYSLKMSGSVEVPKGAPKGGGTATISIRGAQKQLCWTFHLTGVTAPLVSHIHSGGAGVAGPVVIPLGGKYKASGCTSVAPALLTKIEAAPKKYYVNVHNAKYP